MNEKVTKNDLVEAVFNKLNYRKEDLSLVFDAFLVEIKNSLQNASTIELRGFGTFELRLRKGRENARNPKTGEKISVDSRYTAIFRPGVDLKEKLKNIEK